MPGIDDILTPIIKVDPVEEIINYIMNTPENINCNILREKLRNLVSVAENPPM